jgi:hypothetical protein
MSLEPCALNAVHQHFTLAHRDGKDRVTLGITLLLRMIIFLLQQEKRRNWGGEKTP